MLRQQLLIIAHTPYHIVLAHAIARHHEDRYAATLFVVGDFCEADLLAICLQESNDHRFVSIRQLPGNFETNQFDDEALIRQKNVGYLKAYLQRRHTDKLVTFNDYTPESQAAYHFGHLNNPQLVWACGEDGGSFYGTSSLQPPSKRDAKHCRRFYGAWWQPVSVFGESPDITEIWAIYPDLVRPELRTKTLHAISREYIEELRQADWPRRYFHMLGGSLVEFTSVDSLVICAHSEYSQRNLGYTFAIQACVAMLRLSGHKFAYKLHPRESADTHPPSIDDNPVTVPKAFPVELLLLILPVPLQCVLGDQTSALMTTRWLSETTKVYSLATMLTSWDPRLIETFDALGVTVLAEVEHLRPYLCSSGSEQYIKALYALVENLYPENSHQTISHDVKIPEPASASIELEAMKLQLAAAAIECRQVHEELSQIQNSKAMKVIRAIQKMRRLLISGR